MGASKSKATSTQQKSGAQQPGNKPAAGTALSSSSSSGISPADRAMLQLKLQRDKLHAVIRRSSTVLQRETDQARVFLRDGHKDKALYCLKRKALQSKQIENVQKMLENIQQSIESIDFARLEADVVASLREGTKCLTELQKSMSPEEVERVMDEAFDAIAVSKEVTDLLNQNLDGDVLWDDDTLLKELQESSAKPEISSQVKTTGNCNTTEENTRELLAAVKVPQGEISEVVEPISTVSTEEELDTRKLAA